MKIAFQRGEVDPDKVADEMTETQLEEWIAFGALEGWFPVERKPEGRNITPDNFAILGN